MRHLLAIILPASAALHVAVAFVLPESTRIRRPAEPVSVVVVAAATPSPAPPRPDPTPPPPEPEPAAVSPAPSPSPSTSPLRAREPTPAATPEPAAPFDFTGSVVSNDPSGVAVSMGARGAAFTRAPAMPVSRPATRHVVASQLGRAPRPPVLDAELERNYPASARASAVSGTASLEVEILADGRIGRVKRVSESFAGFGAACERTIRAGLWGAPLDREGSPVATEIKYVCRFEVRS